MSKKIILNDNEVVTNEDVTKASEWSNRDHLRVMDGVVSGDMDVTGPAAGTFIAEAIASGLGIDFSSTNLDVTVQPGQALFRVGTFDADTESPLQLATLESPYTISLPVADGSGYRWSLIEVGVETLVGREDREVLTRVGPYRKTLVTTSVEKTRTRSLRFRVRSGAANSTYEDAALPSLQPDLSWLPLWAVLVAPSQTVISGANHMDMRKFAHRMVSGGNASFLRGWDSAPPSLYKRSTSVMMTSAREVVVGGYRGTLVGLNARSFVPQAPSVGANDNLARRSGLALNTNDWFYIYAYRPSSSCGFIGLMIDSTPPLHGNEGYEHGNFNSVFGSPGVPGPFPASGTASYHFLGSVKFRLDATSGLFEYRDFHKAGNYVVLSGARSTNVPTGANYIAQSALTGSGTVTLNLSALTDVNGDQILPDHARMAKINFSFLATGAGSISIQTDDGSQLWATAYAGAGGSDSITLDVPLPFSGNMGFIVVKQGTPSITYDIVVTGFYEDLP
jgi:hypothetical protein